MSRMVNSLGISLIKEYEGYRSKAYLDTGGVPTIGYGHTRGVQMGQECTPEIAEAWLEADLDEAEKAVSRLVKVPLTDNQYAALVSFTFNLGVARLQSSTLLKKLNAGDYAGAQGQFGRWVFDNGKELPGLVKRRAAEAALFSMKDNKNGV